MKSEKRGYKLLRVLLSCVLMLSFVPAVAYATGSGSEIATAITIKPKAVSGEYIPVGEVIYGPDQVEYVGDGRLEAGDVFAEVVFSGQQRYAGTSSSSIVSYKVMRGTEDVTHLYTGITKEEGTITVTPCGVPAPSMDVTVFAGETLSIADIEAVLGFSVAEAGTPTLQGDGTYSATAGYTAPDARGNAKLVFPIAAEDVNSDGVADLSAYDVELAIAITNVYTVGVGGDYPNMFLALDSASNGDTIQLVSDINMGKNYFGAPAGWTLVLDLNGYTLTREWTQWGGDNTTVQSVIYNRGNLTIKDSSAAKTGKIQGYGDVSGIAGWNQDFCGTAISNAAGATLRLEGGTVARGDVDSFGYYTVYNKGAFIMIGGLITNDSCASALVCNVTGGSSFEMTGGELKQLDFQTLKNEPGSTVEISGGTLTSNDRTLQNYGTAEVSGGTLNGDIQIPESGDLTVTDGTINGELYGRDNGTGTVIVGDVTISGGDFSVKPADTFLAEGFAITENADGSFTAKEEEKTTAQIGTTMYASLAKAIAAAQPGETVKLLKDVTENISISKNLTLDLGGFTLQGVEYTFSDGSKEIRALTADAGTVVVQNGTIKGRVNVYDAAQMTIESNVVIETTSLGEDSCYGIVVWGDGVAGEADCKTPELVLKGKVKVTGNGFGISTNGTDTSDPVIIINEGAEVTSEDIAIYLPAGSLDISGGTITGTTAVYFKSTNMIISGGTFVGNGAKADYEFNGNGANATGDAIVIDNCNYPNGIGEVVVTGGDFSSANGQPVGSYKGNGTEAPLGGFIAGGTFDAAPAEDLLADGFEAVTGTDGFKVQEKVITIVEGDGQVWIKGSTTGLTFKSNDEFIHFELVEVDGRMVERESVEVKEGSIVVTLKPEFLETLAIGKHTIVIQSGLERPSAEFTVRAAGVPQTGDNTALLLWSALILLAGCGVLGARFVAKKAHTTK